MSKSETKKKLNVNGLFDIGLTDFAIHFFCFISVLFIGADKFGVKMGVNFRLDQVFLVILSVLLLIKNGFKITLNKWIIAFAVFSMVSTFLAFNFYRAVLFYFSIIYNIFFLFYAFENYVRIYGLSKFINIWRKTLYLQFIIFVIQYVLKVVFKTELPFLQAYGEFRGIPRFNLWFYEPSYLATYLIFWFAYSLFQLVDNGNHSYIKDVLIGFLMMILSTSSSGLIGMALTVALVLLIYFIKNISVKSIIVFCSLLVAIIVATVIFKPIIEVFWNRLFTENLNEASGGRIEGWTETFNVFLGKPLFGVGPGNYGLYLFGNSEVVPTNVTLEMLSTLGIFATLSFYGIYISQISKCRRILKKNKSEKSISLTYCIIAFVIFTVILQINQGYLRLYHWMFFGIISGGIKELKNASKEFTDNKRFLSEN